MIAEFIGSVIVGAVFFFAVSVAGGPIWACVGFGLLGFAINNIALRLEKMRA